MKSLTTRQLQLLESELYPHANNDADAGVKVELRELYWKIKAELADRLRIRP